MLSKIRHYVPPTELKSIYYAIFSSHMMYGAQVWGQSITTHTEKIFKLQNRAMRIINFSDFRAEADPLYKDNKILKLDDYIKMQNCLFVHDFLHKNLPECFDDYFQKPSHQHNTRFASSLNNFAMVRITSAIERSLLKYIGPKVALFRNRGPSWSLWSQINPISE